MNRKEIIVINGKGGTGKDTLCKSLSEQHKVLVVSAIDPIKEIAKNYGWDGEKDDKARRFLADLKKAFVDYNNLPTEYLLNKTNSFINSDAEILFVHIREADQIDMYKEAILPMKCITLLVTREEIDQNHYYGNKADDDVFNYNYDYVFANNDSLVDSKKKFRSLINNILKSKE